jgi:hypothetical protein
MGSRAWVAMAILVCLWTSNLAVAADWSLVPAVTQRSEFNSNLNYDFRHPISDYIFTLQPAVDFNYTSEISQLQGHLGLTGQHFIAQSHIDHVDQNYQINGRYQAAPRINLSLNTSYMVDTTLQEELLTSGLVMSRTPRQSFMAAPALTYNITERLLGAVNYNFNRVLYQDPHYTDYTNHQAGLNLTYLLKNERTTLINNNIVRETLYAGGNIFRSLGVYLGGIHKFSERWDVSLMSGVNISFFSFNTRVLDFSQAPYFILVKTKRIESSNLTPYVNVSTNYRWTNLALSAGFSRDQSTSAYGAIYEFNRLYFSCAYNFSERLSASLKGDYSLSNLSGQSGSSEYNYYDVSPALTYRITERLSLSSGYGYGAREDITGGRTARVHMAWVQFSYTYPVHYQR